MLYAGLDLSRKRLDFHLLDAEGATVEVGAAPPDADGLRGLTRLRQPHDRPCLLEPAPKLLERVLREVGATQLRHDAEPT